MNSVVRVCTLGWLVLWAASSALAQSAYIGYVYPAGGQQGTTFRVQLGGQRLNGVYGADISGEGVTAEVVHYYRKLGNQEMTLIREQLKLLQANVAKMKKADKEIPKHTERMIARLEKRMTTYVNRPACAAHSDITILDVAAAPDAVPGPREIRLISARGMTNPLVFHVGQVPEVARKAMKTCNFQVLGKEHLAQRKRPPEDEEVQLTLPCTMNGQIASGEVNRYRFEATEGQRLVVSVHARRLIPYIADAVPGWFQPVVALHNAAGKEVAYNDDFHFKPDPTLYYEVPADGEYVLSITDAIYRGREDFVYRMTVSELPFVTGIFPLGARAGETASIETEGWNLGKAKCVAPPADAAPGIHQIVAVRDGLTSNRVPFAVDTLPECLDQESNDDVASAQQVAMPIIVNGRVDRPDDWDVFAVEGAAGEKIVAEVQARRLDSPVDSMLKITDADGRVLALNDDSSDPGSGLNTHHADSYLMLELPADGVYYVHLGDTTRNGGRQFAYRLRISAPRPDFELRVVPSGGGLRSKGTVAPAVYVIRRDGFDGAVQLGMKDPPEGFLPTKAVLPAGKEMVKFPVRTRLKSTEAPVALAIEGRAEIDGQQVAREAVPADDRMQAFLWRHLVPAENLMATVFDPAFKPTPKRVAPELTEALMTELAPDASAGPPKFSQRQVAGRLRQLKLLYEEGLLTNDFYLRKVAECEAAK